MSFSIGFPPLPARGSETSNILSLSPSLPSLSLLDLLVESLLENDVTVRPFITAPPPSQPPLPLPDPDQPQLANLVLDTTPRPRPGVRHHRRGKEKRFGRGFRLNRNKHPFAVVLKPTNTESSFVEDLTTRHLFLYPRHSPLSSYFSRPTLLSTSDSPTQGSSSPQFANQVIAQDQDSVGADGGQGGPVAQQQLTDDNTVLTQNQSLDPQQSQVDCDL